MCHSSPQGLCCPSRSLLASLKEEEDGLQYVGFEARRAETPEIALHRLSSPRLLCTGRRLLNDPCQKWVLSFSPAVGGSLHRSWGTSLSAAWTHRGMRARTASERRRGAEACSTFRLGRRGRHGGYAPRSTRNAPRACGLALTRPPRRWGITAARVGKGDRRRSRQSPLKLVHSSPRSSTHQKWCRVRYWGTSLSRTHTSLRGLRRPLGSFCITSATKNSPDFATPRTHEECCQHCKPSRFSRAAPAPRRWILTVWGFSFPITLTIWHMTFCSILSFALVRNDRVTVHGSARDDTFCAPNKFRGDQTSIGVPERRCAPLLLVPCAN